MKSSSFKLSVGLVGFLRQETPASCESPRALVGFSETPPTPDHTPDHTPDQKPAAVGHKRVETDRIARLDAARREADRKAKRGYDFDPTAPSHVEYVDRADPLSDPGHPAYSIITTCRSYGIALRVDSDGTLVIGEAGSGAKGPAQPWPTLIRAIEAHTEAVACLVAAGWHLRADFPDQNIQ
jgi:hypothetical protein